MSNNGLDEFIHEARIAYFSMEVALHSEIPTYSGGLMVRTAADLELPLVTVRADYFRQQLDAQGRQIEQPHTSRA